MTFDIRILITPLISSNFSTIPLWQELKIWCVCVCEAFSGSCYNYSILYTTVLLSLSYTMFFLLLWACSRCMPLWTFTLWVLCCDVRYDFCIKTRCSVRLYLHLFVGGIMSYLRYLCLFAHSGVQHILWCVGFFLVYPMLLVSLDCPFGIL